jgi:type IV pilus biogenesis/stability protein PilW
MFRVFFASPIRTRAFRFSALIGWALLTACASSPAPGEVGPKKSPRERAQLLIEAANGSLIENDPIGALQFLERAEALDPAYGPIYHAKALAFAARKDFPQALKEMKRAVDIDPENPFALNTYGKFLIDAGRLDEAEAPLLKAGNNVTFRESYKANTNLGILYYRKNEFDKAEARFQKAINDDAANACIAYYYKGHIAVRRNQIAEAEKLYERATEKQCSAFADAHLALGMMYERQGKVEQARKKYLELNQNFPEAKASESAKERLKKLP